MSKTRQIEEERHEGKIFVNIERDHTHKQLHILNILSFFLN